MKTLVSLLVAAVLVVGVTANAKHKPGHGKNAKKDSLYLRLGKTKGIKTVVDDFVTNCATDDRIKSFFTETAGDPTKLATFKSHLVDQICQAAGGPCKYKGKDMKTAHSGMGVKKDDFAALVDDLTKALDKNGVKEADKNTLLSVLGPMEKDIVEEKAASNDVGTN